MSADGRDESRPPDAEALFAEYLRRRESDDLAFDRFLSEHPQHAVALRALYSIHQDQSEAAWFPVQWLCCGY
jgi:hypothetical protein